MAGDEVKVKKGKKEKKEKDKKDKEKEKSKADKPEKKDKDKSKDKDKPEKKDKDRKDKDKDKKKDDAVSKPSTSRQPPPARRVPTAPKAVASDDYYAGLELPPSDDEDDYERDRAEDSDSEKPLTVRVSSPPGPQGPLSAALMP
jgi:ATP-binding cassette, subfamily F, member 1